MQLDNLVIAVTGGFGILGRATVDALRAQGARVAVIDLAQAPEGSGGDHASLLLGGTDLSDADAARACFERIVQHYGRLDGLVNIAGGYRWTPVADSDLDTWDFLQRINLRTTVSATLAALPHLAANGGAIVNIGAMGALSAGPGNGPYAASKAGVHKLTEALAAEQKDRGIRVNAVLPSIIDTPTNRADMPDADHTRWVAPADIAAVIGFLLSPAAKAVTGALVPVPGRV